MRSHLAIGSALLLAGAAAGATEAPPQGELGNVTLEADRGLMTGDIEVDGELVGTFEYAVRKAEAKEADVLLSGVLRAQVGDEEEELRGVQIALSEPEDVCDSMTATPTELRLRRLGIVLPAAPVDLDIDAETGRGQMLAAMLCTSAHLLADQEELLAASARDTLALANRALRMPARKATSSASSVTAAEPTPVAPAPTAEHAQAPAALPRAPKPARRVLAEPAPAEELDEEEAPASRTVVLPHHERAEARPVVRPIVRPVTVDQPRPPAPVAADPDEPDLR